MKEIPLTKGKVAFVDDDLYEFLMQWKWSTLENDHYYAVRTDKFNKMILMHRVVMNAPKGTKVDHRNSSETLDNRRENLRLCTNSQNTCNSKKRSDNTSGYKGVTWSKVSQKYQAGITKDGQRYHLGLFIDPKDAALAYDAKAHELHGEFARTNF